MSVDGRMSADLIRAQQPELLEALDHGLRWTIIKAEAVKRWPQLPKLVQAVYQIAGQLHNGETHFELLENIQSLSIDMSVNNPTGAIDWDAVKDRIHIDDLPYLCTLVQNYGGGRDGLFIRNLSEFVTAAVPDNRRIPSHVASGLHGPS